MINWNWRICVLLLQRLCVKSDCCCKSEALNFWNAWSLAGNLPIIEVLPTPDYNCNNMSFVIKIACWIVMLQQTGLFFVCFFNLALLREKACCLLAAFSPAQSETQLDPFRAAWVCFNGVAFNSKLLFPLFPCV